MALLELTAPWTTYYSELKEFFKSDRDVHIIYNKKNYTIEMYVENKNKADALNTIIPSVKHFGDIELKINIIPANNCYKVSYGSIYQDAFCGNSAVKEVKTFDFMSTPITYIVCKKEVVQYYNDDIGDLNGVCSTLYQDIADRIFEVESGVFFCTDTSDTSEYCIPAKPIFNPSVHL